MSLKVKDVTDLRTHIEAVLRAYPELAQDAELRADMLEGETAIADLLTVLIRLGEDARGYRDGTKEQQARLKSRADRYDQQIEFSRALMMAILESAQLRKFELPEGTVFLRNNAPQIVGEVNGDRLPNDLVTIVRKPDKAAIKEALETGRVVEGLQLSNSPPSVVVMVK